MLIREMSGGMKEGDCHASDWMTEGNSMCELQREMKCCEGGLGISKIILTILWPVILIGLIIAGLFYIAFPALIIFAVIAFVITRN